METFDIALVEQPVPASDRNGLALITRAIPASVEADESAGSVDDVFRLVGDRAVDSVNLKITKLGGIRKTLAAATICHAGGVACRLGAAFGPSLLQAFSAHVAAVFPSIEVPCELSEHLHLTDDPFTALPVTTELSLFRQESAAESRFGIPESGLRKAKRSNTSRKIPHHCPLDQSV